MAYLKGWLIDECLSPKLADVAAKRSVEGAHATRRGLTSTPDPVIARWCVTNDFALVTNNARDFRRIYSSLDLHPGLVVILPEIVASEQVRLFALILDRVEREPDLVNKLMEIDFAGAITIKDWPA